MLTTLIDKKVTWLQVTVHDPPLVTVHKPKQDLMEQMLDRRSR